jgi:archaellum component FlaF (FlaF/FlaG flagellin family)
MKLIDKIVIGSILISSLILYVEHKNDNIKVYVDNKTQYSIQYPTITHVDNSKLSYIIYCTTNEYHMVTKSNGIVVKDISCPLDYLK